MSQAVMLRRTALILGVAGLLPQAIALLATFSEADRYIGLAAGYFYAALIFSFLGGSWWGIATSRDDMPDWIYLVAVLPSLVAFASGIPWMTGATWPGPSLGLLGIGIFASALVDRKLAALGAVDRGYLTMRYILSAGLGGLTLVLASRS